MRGNEMAIIFASDRASDVIPTSVCFRDKAAGTAAIRTAGVPPANTESYLKLVLIILSLIILIITPEGSSLRAGLSERQQLNVVKWQNHSGEK